MAKKLVIKTTMDNKDFESKYNDLTRQLQVAESKLESSKTKLSSYQKELQDVSRQYEIMSEDAKRTFTKIAELERKMNDPNSSVGAMDMMDYNDMTESYEKMSTYLNKLERQQDSLTNKVSVASTQVMNAENNVSKVSNKIKEIEQTSNNIDFSKMVNGMEKLVKKVSKWGLILVGIRSMYNAIRMSINAMTQYDEQLKADMEYLQYALAMTLKPIVDALVPIIFKVLNAINQVVYSLTGVNLFANSMAKGFNSANKNAKELKKTLAGFDTATVLNDGGSGTSVGGGVSGVATQYNLGEVNDTDLLSSLDNTFTKIQNKVYGFFGKIKDNILNMLVGTDWYAPVSLIIDGIGNVIGGLGSIVGDIFALIIGICTGNLDLIFQSFTSMFGHIVQILKGLGQITWGVLLTVLTIIKWVLGEIWNAFKEAFDGIVKLFKWVGEKIGNVLWSALKLVINGALTLLEKVINVPIKAINKLLSIINKTPGVDISKIETVSLPRLATGGIVNNPGRGVPIGGAIVGESGREGVLPLTDSQAMSQLGKEIGQWISVNVDLTTKLDGRVLSRSLERVKDNNSFIRNGV